MFLYFFCILCMILKIVLVIYLANKYCRNDKNKDQNHSTRHYETYEMFDIRSESALPSVSLIAPSMSTSNETFVSSPWLSKQKQVPKKDAIIVLPTRFCTSTPVRNTQK